MAGPTPCDACGHEMPYSDVTTKDAEGRTFYNELCREDAQAASNINRFVGPRAQEPNAAIRQAGVDQIVKAVRQNPRLQNNPRAQDERIRGLTKYTHWQDERHQPPPQRGLEPPGLTR